MGVSRRGNRFVAQFGSTSADKYLGSFTTALAAAEAYDTKARAAGQKVVNFPRPELGERAPKKRKTRNKPPTGTTAVATAAGEGGGAAAAQAAANEPPPPPQPQPLASPSQPQPQPQQPSPPPPQQQVAAEAKNEARAAKKSLKAFLKSAAPPLSDVRGILDAAVSQGITLEHMRAPAKLPASVSATERAAVWAALFDALQVHTEGDRLALRMAVLSGM